MADSDARLHMLASGEERTLLRTTCRKFGSADARYALAECPVCFKAPFSQWVWRSARLAISVNVLTQPCFVCFSPDGHGNSQLPVLPGTVLANATCAASRWNGHGSCPFPSSSDAARCAAGADLGVSPGAEDLEDSAFRFGGSLGSGGL